PCPPCLRGGTCLPLACACVPHFAKVTAHAPFVSLLMAKAKTIFACQSCGYHSPKWLGKCPDCNQWNTFAEERFEKASTPRGELSLGTREDPAPIHEIDTSEEGRVLSGIGEFDRVIGGDPGIGKSTLLLQAFAAVSQKDITCLYVSGEESPRQIKMRAERLGIA